MAPQHLDDDAIYNIARKIESADDRREYLQQVCGNDMALLARVEARLAMLGQGHELKDVRNPDVSATMDASVDHRTTWYHDWQLQLMEQIGEGGMGLVFLAEQQQRLRRKVALKSSNPGWIRKRSSHASKQSDKLWPDGPSAHRQSVRRGRYGLGSAYFVMEWSRAFRSRNTVIGKS